MAITVHYVCQIISKEYFFIIYEKNIKKKN